MKRNLVKSHQPSPGRCHCCGHLMIMVRVSDPLMDASVPHSIGWRCLVCGRTVGLEAMSRRYEDLQAWPMAGRQMPGAGHGAEIRL